MNSENIINRVLLSQTGIDQLKVGMKVEVEYINPANGWFVIWLEDTQGNVILSYCARFDEKRLVLNTLNDGKWGNEECPSGYNFTPGALQNVSIVVTTQDCFTVQVNGCNPFPFNSMQVGKLSATSVRSVVVNFRPLGGAAAPQVKGVSYKYP